MNDEPKRWLDGGTDDPKLRAFMQIGGEELAPPEVLARVVLPAPPVSAAPAALEPHTGALVAFKWIAGLLLLAAASYFFLRSQATSHAAVVVPKPSHAAPAHRLAAPSALARAAPHEAPSVATSTTTDSLEPATPQSSQRTRASLATNSERPLPAKLRRPVQVEPAPAAASAPPASPADTVQARTAEAAPAATAEGSTATQSGSVSRPNIHASELQRAVGTEQKELQQLEAARRVLATDPTRALALMKRHAQDYPRSWLAEERDALVVRTYLALHDAAHAHAALAQFKQRYPESPQLRQLEAFKESMQASGHSKRGLESP
jgi:hypothetical protein